MKMKRAISILIIISICVVCLLRIRPRPKPEQESRLSNEQRLQRLKQECEEAKVRVSGKKVASNGGFCPKATDELRYQLDEPLAMAAAVKLFQGQTVASYGEGLGMYRNYILNTTLVREFDGFDGSPFIEDMTNGSIKFLDLTLQQDWLKIYDWVMCLEVAEHIPKEHEKTLLDNIQHHARVGVVLSWAPPGQGGIAHVNEQPFEYVVEAMRTRGFRLNTDATTMLRQACTISWLKNNVAVFMRSAYKSKL